jgi:hypothetical protein
MARRTGPLENPEAINVAVVMDLAQRSGKPKPIRAARIVGPLLAADGGELL